MKLYTDTELAELFGVTVEKLTKLRTWHKWPHVKLGRTEVRFTEDQVAQIIAACTVETDPEPTRVPKIPGQTARSVAAKRRRSS